MIIDPHCHLDDPELDQTLETALEEALKAHVGGALIPGFGPERWQRQTELVMSAGRDFTMWGAFGLHPWAIDGWRDIESYQRELEAGWQAHAVTWGSRLKAIGEFGLDRSRETSLELQRAIFDWHLQRAGQSGLPIILHLVRSDGLAMEMLSAGAPWNGVIHGFSSHAQTLASYSELGLSFSYGSGLMRFEKVRESLRVTPPDRLMFETDAPQGLKGQFTEPRGPRQFTEPRGPRHLQEIVQAASQVLGKSVEYLLARHRENCARVFSVGLL